MSLSLVEINRGENQKLFEVSGFSTEVYNLPHKVLRAVERVPLDQDDVNEANFTDTPWDCSVGFMVLGSKEDMVRVFDDLLEYLEGAMDEEVDEDFDESRVPARIALMEPVDGKGPYVIIGDGYVEDTFSEDFEAFLDSYTVQGSVWYAIIGAAYNDEEAVPAVIDAFCEQPASPFADMWIAFLSSGLKGLTYKDEWQLWYADEEFDEMRKCIIEYRAKNSIDI